jgi:hypothetical protein
MKYYLSNWERKEAGGIRRRGRPNYGDVLTAKFGDECAHQ